MPLSPEERSDTQAELTRVRETLARLRAAPDRDESHVVALELRAAELRRRIEAAERGLGPLREDGFYGSGL
jgi:predicted  nucleic acid-binding Zn-ribbon protein